MIRILGIKSYIDLFFKGWYAKGIIIAISILGLILFLIYSDGDTKDFKLAYGTTSTIEGYVNNIEETNASINDESVEKYFYGYAVNDEVYKSYCYGTLYLDYDQKIKVEYLLSNPQISRIVDSSNSLFGLFAIYLFGFFLLIPVIMLIMHLGKTIKYGRIISKGKITKAEQTLRDPTNTTINDRRLFRLIYQFEILGQVYEVIEKTTYPEEYKMTERVVYNVDNPSKSVLFSKLPISIQRLIH